MSRSAYIRIIQLSLRLCIVLILVLPGVSADVAVGQAVPTFIIQGTGFGHGVGMSQYGAQGSALAGKDYRWILARYYTGTTVATAPAKTIRVNIDAAANYDSKSEGYNAGYTKVRWRIKPGQSDQRLIVGGVASMGGTYTFTGKGSSIVVTAPNGTETTLSGSITVGVSGGNPPLMEVVEGTGIYTLPGTKYRGSLVLSASGSKIKLLNVLPMEAYLYGVVPRESFSSWHHEALKAQAVAARSYAYGSGGELYCTTMSQAYQGFGAKNSLGVWVGEMASTNQAVDATKDQVVKYGDRIVRAYYFSHSGGHTANVEDVWVPSDGNLAAKAALFPEFRGVVDIYEHLARPPYAPWPPSKVLTYTGSQVADRLRGVPGVPPSPAFVTGVSVERAASGHARYVTFRFSDNSSVRLTGSTVRSRLGLLSTNFRFSGFPISRIHGPDRYATAATISSRAFPGTAPAVVVASGEDFADALTGSALAGAVGGPLLLTKAATLPVVTAAELSRLRPSEVYLLGGHGAVSPAVESSIKARLPAARITRVGGQDRYETASKVAGIVSERGGSSSAIIVNGRSWADGASVSALGYARKMPILLTPADALHPHVSDYIASRRPATVLLVGGDGVLSESVTESVKQLTGSSPVTLAGLDRYETSAEVARYSMTTTPTFVADEVYIATGIEYADALTGGTLAGIRRRPLVLMHRDRCTDGTASFLERYKATIVRLQLLGGPGAISEKGWVSVEEVMMR